MKWNFGLLFYPNNVEVFVPLIRNFRIWALDKRAINISIASKYANYIEHDRLIAHQLRTIRKTNTIFVVFIIFFRHVSVFYVGHRLILIWPSDWIKRDLPFWTPLSAATEHQTKMIYYWIIHCLILCFETRKVTFRLNTIMNWPK